LQFGVNASRRFELEGTGADSGDGRALDVVARQQVAGAAGLVGSLRSGLCGLLQAFHFLSEFKTQLIGFIVRQPLGHVREYDLPHVCVPL
jgi:hypothetical protein